MDLKVIEEGNGGELVKTAKDLVVISGLQNMVYLTADRTGRRLVGK
jgi:hypothetical protein